MVLFLSQKPGRRKRYWCDDGSGFNLSGLISKSQNSSSRGDLAARDTLAANESELSNFPASRESFLRIMAIKSNGDDQAQLRILARSRLSIFSTTAFASYWRLANSSQEGIDEETSSTLSHPDV